MLIKFRETHWTAEDKAQVAAAYKELIAVRRDKTLTREKRTEKIKALKDTIKTFHSTFYAVRVSFAGKHEDIVIPWQDTPIEREAIKKALNDKFKKIRAEREQRKQLDYKNYSFNGYKYKKYGNTFTQPGSILKLVGTVDADAKLAAPKKPHAFQQDNFVGVEIECLIKCSDEFLDDKLIEAGLETYVKVNSDGSIQMEDGYARSTEVTVMAKEKEIRGIIERVCAVLASKRVAAKANNSCGIHVHLDMRHRNAEESFKNLYYAQDVLLGMLPSNRKEGSHATRYCKRNVTPDIDKQIAKGDRYHVINVDSLKKYKTIEIRAHSGTTNATKINNWIEILTSIVNSKCPELKYPVKNFSKFVQTYNINPELAKYIVKRTNKFAGNKLTELDMAV